MGDERAETYLRLLAEREVRRRSAASPDAAAGVLWKIHRTGSILVAAGVLDQDFADRFGTEIEAALTVRSSVLLNRSGAGARVFHPPHGAPIGGPDPHRRRPAAQPMRITPIGQTLRVTHDRAPSDLHFLSLASTPTRAAITVAMRMGWPPDGSSADLEVTGAGYHHLPYEQLWLVDDHGDRYRPGFDGEGGTATWQGVIRLSAGPPPGARWLDLIADGSTRLIRLDLRHAGPVQAAGGSGPGTGAAESGPGMGAGGSGPGMGGSGPGMSAAERLLVSAAESTLAGAWELRGPVADPDLGEIARTLTEAGVLAPGSPLPGQLAALCERLGLTGHGIPGPAAETIPAPWASVVAQRRDRYLAGQRQEVFAPLATVLPDVDGTRFALAGLSSAAGESYLHVAASGLPELAGRFTRGWDPDFSWWLRDDAGDWHVATMAARDRDAGEAEFRLRLTPPLAGAPDTVEVVVTGASGRVRAVVPVHGTRAMPDT